MDKIIELEAQLEHCDHTIANLREDLKRARAECKDSQDRADIAVMLARALSDGLTGDLGPEGPIRKIINRLHAAEGLAEELTEIEWVPDRDRHGYCSNRCPSCWNEEPETHAPDCARQQRLAAWKEAK